jgi:SAM-dependent methyltransferase
MAIHSISNSNPSQNQVSPHVEPTVTSNYLDWTQRPDSLNSSIAKAFRKVTCSFSSGWGVFNGSSAYGICGVNEHALMKKIIQQAPTGQKDFYVLDIGAGNFQWSKSMADFIDNQTDLPKDIKVHIIGVRGERYVGEREIETDRCKIYNLGAFKIEELVKQFEELGFDLVNQVDFGGSRWCFRHLADPVGTAAQVHKLLRKGGFFFVDGFFFLCNDETMESMKDGNIQMTQLFLDMKAPFLTRYNNTVRSLNHFMLRKPDDSPCRLPMNYLGISYPGDSWQIGSETVTRFRREPQVSDLEGFDLPSSYYDMYGDKKMHDWLKENELLLDPNSAWKPLQDKDRHLAIPPLHQAVQQENREKIEACLDRGDNINESDSMGNTPLHIAIQRKSYEFFTLLLNRGAQIGLSSGGEGGTPLHAAAALDTEGDFIQALLDAGAQVNAKVLYRTPLDCAIEEKNLKAVEMLIKAGAKISKGNYKDLKNSAFASLRAQKMIPKMEKKRNGGGYAGVHHCIKKGDCVVLHSNGFNTMTYYYPNDLNKNPKLIVVDINPQFNLLDDGEWPGFLRVDGYKYKPYDVEEIKKGGFKKVKQYKFGYNVLSL